MRLLFSRSCAEGRGEHGRTTRTADDPAPTCLSARMTVAVLPMPLRPRTTRTVGSRSVAKCPMTRSSLSRPWTTWPLPLPPAWLCPAPDVVGDMAVEGS